MSDAAEPTGLTFVDEDDLPVAFLRIAHVDSDNEAPSDIDSSEEGESAVFEHFLQTYAHMSKLYLRSSGIQTWRCLGLSQAPEAR